MKPAPNGRTVAHIGLDPLVLDTTNQKVKLLSFETGTDRFAFLGG